MGDRVLMIDGNCVMGAECVMYKVIMGGLCMQSRMLRNYQKDICKRVREAFDKHRSVMVQMPTGTGKTVDFVSIQCGVKK